MFSLWIYNIIRVVFCGSVDFAVEFTIEANNNINNCLKYEKNDKAFLGLANSIGSLIK